MINSESGEEVADGVRGELVITTPSIAEYEVAIRRQTALDDLLIRVEMTPGRRLEEVEEVLQEAFRSQLNAPNSSYDCHPVARAHIKDGLASNHRFVALFLAAVALLPVRTEAIKLTTSSWPSLGAHRNAFPGQQRASPISLPGSGSAT